ncbi:Mucin-like protein, partial [Trichoplax sp. H2]
KWRITESSNFDYDSFHHLQVPYYISLNMFSLSLYYCIALVDYCISKPCANNGTCINNSNGYNCTCMTEWTGFNCSDVLIDHCISKPCANSGICINDSNGYNCTCMTGWTGLNCSEAVNYCGSNPCNINGSCISNNNGYNCTCMSGWTGINCSNEIIDYCDSNPCNNGTCFSNSNGFNCTCMPGWTGSNCTQAVYNWQEGDLRLVDGSSSNKGRLEIYHNNQWGTICHDGFGVSDGRVACRQLGYTGFVKYQCCANLGGQGTGPIWLEGISCSGNEYNILDCGNKGWSNTDCDHKEDIGVECQAVPIWEEGDLRLVGGSTSNKGRLEIYHNNQWGTICHDGFGVSDGRVACRQLGYTGFVKYQCCANLGGQGTGPIWLEGISCSGNEYNILDCGNKGWSNTDCDHKEDIGVECQDPSICITANPCSNGKCQLTASGYVCSCYSGYTGQKCDQALQNINYCDSNPCYNNGTCITSNSGYNCTCTSQWTGINCSQVVPRWEEGDLRLVGGASSNEGRLEIYHNNQWGTICHDGFNTNDGKVACRQLGYTGFVKFQCCASLGQGTGPIWLEGISCTGSEYNILDCSNKGWQNTDCNHNEDIGLVCKGDSNTLIVYPSICITANPCTNSKCQLTANGYTCKCSAGFTGQNCEQEIMSFCEHNPCKNGTCINNDNGYSCNCPSGWTGINCSQEIINFCTNKPCGNGLCVNNPNGYTCNCAAGWTGMSCTVELHDYCNPNPCRNGGQCMDKKYGYNCSCSSDWMGVNCTQYVGIQQEGALRLVNGTTVNQGRLEIYHNNAWGTICHDGFNPNDGRVACRQLGYAGFDKYECCGKIGGPGTGPIWLEGIKCSGSESNIIDCLNNGWNQTDCGHHEDIGIICEDPSICITSNPCANGRCVLTLNGYSCKCSQGYTGRNCEIEIRLYPYGPTISDQSFGRVDDMSYTVFLKSPIFYLNKFYHKIYVSMNGFISFDRAYFGSPTRPLYNSHNTPIIAPFFADADSRDSKSSRVYIAQYSIYNPSASGMKILRRATNDINQYQSYVSNSVGSIQYGLFKERVNNFNATLVTVVTWHKVVPFPSSLTAKFDITNTFQLILISNGINLFTTFRYEDKGMNWWKKYKIIKPQAGYTNGSIHYTHELPNSFTKQLLRIDSMVGNYGKLGQWMFRIDDPSVKHINYFERCQVWYSNEPSPSIYLDALRRRPCPCSAIQAIRDRRYRFNFYTFCARSRFSRRASNGERVYQRCCYSSLRRSFGSLITNYPSGSSFIFKNNDLQAKSKTAFTACCEKSSLCTLYSRKRPINKCSGYRPPGRGWFWGDPHIRTLDGKQYTFNGLGEYVLLQSTNSFILQGRTMKAVRNGSLSAAATVFSAFASTENDADTVQFMLNKTLNGIDISINGTIALSMNSLSENETHEYTNVDIIRMSNKTVSAIFSSGVSIEVTLLTQMLTVAFNGPDEIKGTTVGLLGMWNDNVNDDFRRPDGTSLNINSSESQIYYNFGQLWQVTQSNTIFTYLSGLSYNNYTDPSFTPIFGDNIQNLFGNNTEFYNQAVAQCNNNNECLYDAALTLNLEAAVNSKDTSIGYQETTNELENFPPQITGQTTYNVSYGEIFSTELNITDPNWGDNITVELINAPENAQFNPHNYTFTWMVSEYQNISFKFVATDSKGASSELIPQIIMCYCANNGSCDYTAEMVNAGNIDQVECICKAAWSGDHCVQDVDACADEPCFGNTTCVDNPAPESGYTCSGCPLGYYADGAKCSDINECDSGDHQCEQMCINEDGSYSCQCLPGYVLSDDNHNCLDINECKSESANCSSFATCTNQPGSYECTCFTGYEGDGYICTEIDLCSPFNCSQTCNNGTCSCYSGYQLNSDGQTCQDIDECVRFRPCDQLCFNSIGSYYCSCKTGFTGDGSTCTDINECTLAVDNCSLNGTCINNIGSYTCTCKTGFAGNGSTCSDIDECSLGTANCASNAICRNNLGSYTCTCLSGYSGNGVVCQDINECLTNPCNNNAICTNSDGSYGCQCKKGYTGNGLTCDDINECSTNPCNNNAICTNSDGSYVCQCKKGYTGNGLTCDDINECSTNDACNINANCTNSIGSYSCQCKQGFTGNGLTCTDIDECLTETKICSDWATCSNAIGSYRCFCNSGYTGNGTYCQDINECSSSNLNACVTNALCENTNGSYKCNCKNGFSGDGATSCTDINECLTNQNNCDGNALCTNTIGSYACRCRFNYYGNGSYCVPVVACAGNNNCGVKANCMIFENKYYCSCKTGYYSNSPLPQTQLTTDTHCQRGKIFSGSIQFVGTFNSSLNNPSSFVYRSLAMQVKTALTVAFNSSSVTKGIFEQVVITGFKSGSIVANYEVLFKLDANITQDQLTNVLTSHQITINGVNVQNVAVQDFNECANISDNSCSNEQICVNLPGTYACKCNSGYTGPSCNDINECTTGTPCGSNATCINTDGSYNCTCRLGYQGNPYSVSGCSPICSSNYCSNDGTCYYENNQLKCRCTGGYSGDRCTNAYGLIIGISVGSVAGVVLIIVLVYVFFLRKRSTDRKLTFRTSNPVYSTSINSVSGGDNVELNLIPSSKSNETNVYENLNLSDEFGISRNLDTSDSNL